MILFGLFLVALACFVMTLRQACKQVVPHRKPLRYDRQGKPVYPEQHNFDRYC
jgi:hypothetical protein